MNNLASSGYRINRITPWSQDRSIRKTYFSSTIRLLSVKSLVCNR
jgi:hypothetical protein